jgi:hypothetical protein
MRARAGRTVLKFAGRCERLMRHQRSPSDTWGLPADLALLRLVRHAMAPAAGTDSSINGKLDSESTGPKREHLSQTPSA